MTSPKRGRGKKKLGDLVKNIAFAIEFESTKVFDISKAEEEEGEV